MQFLLLGRLEVRRSGEAVPVTRSKQRALLAMLLIEAGRAVSVDRLIDGIWRDDPPETANKTLQTYVSQLRSLLEPERSQGQLGQVLLTEPSGYRLAIDPQDVDVNRFRDLLARGRERVADRPGEARRLLAEALNLWRGPALADFAFEPFAQGEIAKLEELRLTAVEERVGAELALGLHATAVGDLREHLHEHPLQERMWGQLMLALYRSGRQADALEAYEQARRALQTELGLDPGPALQRLEERILRQDPDLEWSPPLGVAASPNRAERAEDAVALADERRRVTVLCAQLETTQNEPGGHLTARLLESLRQEVRRHGGGVAAADGPITALFGFPVAHEDDAERAVRAGLAIQDLAGSISLPSASIGVRIGIDTGELRTTPADGPGAIVQDAAAADARALAEEAGPGEVLVGESTRRASDSAIRYERSGSGAWRAVDAGPNPSLRPLSATPWVGRQAELGLLRTLWDRTVSEHRPHLVTVVGPPGIGKSRLRQEFLPLAAERGGQVLSGRSLPYGDSTFGAVAQTIRGAVGVSESESSQTLRWKLEAWLQTFLPEDEQPRAAQYLITLLTLVGDLVLPEQRPVVHVSTRRFFETVASRQPTVLIFEDLHWAHPELLDLLESVAARVQSLPLLILAFARPELLEERPGWGGGLPAYTTLPVDALSQAEARRLAGALVDDPGMVDTIESAAGGNPLFIEELAGWVAEGHHVAHEMPATVRAVISARLDLLPAVERSVLVDASVMGDPFWRRGLERLSERSIEELDEALESLQLRGLIRPRTNSSIAGDREFEFRHELFAEVAYATLWGPTRADKHLRVASYLEDTGSEVVSAAVLARHWGEAGISIARSPAWLRRGTRPTEDGSVPARSRSTTARSSCSPVATHSGGAG